MKKGCGCPSPVFLAEDEPPCRKPGPSTAQGRESCRQGDSHHPTPPYVPRNSAESRGHGPSPALPLPRSSSRSHSGKQLTDACRQPHVSFWPKNGKGGGCYRVKRGQKGQGVGSGGWRLWAEGEGAEWEVGCREGGRGMGLTRENSAMSSHVLKNMSCQAGLGNYCHLCGVAAQENQIIRVSCAQCLPPSQQPVTNAHGCSVPGSALCLSCTWTTNRAPRGTEVSSLYGYDNHTGPHSCTGGPWKHLRTGRKLRPFRSSMHCIPQLVRLQ